MKTGFSKKLYFTCQDDSIEIAFGFMFPLYASSINLLNTFPQCAKKKFLDDFTADNFMAFKLAALSTTFLFKHEGAIQMKFHKFTHKNFNEKIFQRRVKYCRKM